jgi:hypothetical protein
MSCTFASTSSFPGDFTAAPGSAFALCLSGGASRLNSFEGSVHARLDRQGTRDCRDPGRLRPALTADVPSSPMKTAGSCSPYFLQHQNEYIALNVSG